MLAVSLVVALTRIASLAPRDAGVGLAAADLTAACLIKRRDGAKAKMILGVASPFFPGILLSKAAGF